MARQISENTKSLRHPGFPSTVFIEHIPMKLRLLSLFVAGALAGALATTGMQVYADKQAETKLPLMEVRQVHERL